MLLATTLVSKIETYLKYVYVQANSVQLGIFIILKLVVLIKIKIFFNDKRN